MTTPTLNPVRSVTARLNRIPKLLTEFESSLDKHAFIEIGAFEISGDSVYLPHPLDLMPHEAQVIAGEIIHDLRSALDNLVYEASRRNNGDVEVKQTQFVIADDEKSYRNQSWRIRALTEAQRHKVESIQPFSSDDKWASLLSDLSNRDKHRYLIALHNHSHIDISVEDQVVHFKSGPPEWTLAGKYPPVHTLNTLLYRVC